MRAGLARKLRALPRWLGALAIRVISPLLIPLERRLVRDALNSGRECYPPVFIIGAPRSGSTLLYKAVTDAFGFSFFNNFSAIFFRTPCIGVSFSRALGLRSIGGFDNRYGSLHGWGSPHECGPYWYRWFPRGTNVYTPAGVLRDSEKRRLREEIAAVSCIERRPVAFKNLFNSMRIRALVECFPDATFIVCRRDPVQNALSLLKGRIEKNGDKSKWWTLPPRQVSSLLRLPYPEQVAGQVYWINKQIYSDMNAVGSARFFVVDYERFCEDPHEMLRRMRDFLLGRGLEVSLDLSNVPARFSARRVIGIDPLDITAVEQAVESIYERQPN